MRRRSVRRRRSCYRGSSLQRARSMTDRTRKSFTNMELYHFQTCRRPLLSTAPPSDCADSVFKGFQSHTSEGDTDFALGLVPLRRSHQYELSVMPSPGVYRVGILPARPSGTASRVCASIGHYDVSALIGEGGMMSGPQQFCTAPWTVANRWRCPTDLKPRIWRSRCRVVHVRPQLGCWQEIVDASSITTEN